MCGKVAGVWWGSVLALAKLSLASVAGLCERLLPVAWWSACLHAGFHVCGSGGAGMGVGFGAPGLLFTAAPLVIVLWFTFFTCPKMRDAC